MCDCVYIHPLTHASLNVQLGRDGTHTVTHTHTHTHTRARARTCSMCSLGMRSVRHCLAKGVRLAAMTMMARCTPSCFMRSATTCMCVCVCRCACVYVWLHAFDLAKHKYIIHAPMQPFCVCACVSTLRHALIHGLCYDLSDVCVCACVLCVCVCV